ncbi:MAG: toprim domain-containing protein [bacterium]
MDKPKKENSYDAKDIEVLEGLEPVRKRPGMYIGSTGPEGLHHLIWECADNCLDEFMGGNGSNMEVTLFPNNRVKVTDDGRGIPVDKHPQTKKSALETVMTTLHAGAKFGSKAYQVAGGLHGVGVSVVNALSLYLRAEVCRDGFRYFQEYKKGKPTSGLNKGEKCKGTGTTVIFEPDGEIFPDLTFNYKKITNHFRQQAYLTKGIKIKIDDKRNPEDEKSYTFYFEGGIKSYVTYLTKGSPSKQQNVFYVSGENSGLLVECAFRYNQETESYEESFANNIYTGEGGTHLTGFRTALTRTLNDYARKNNFLKENEENLSGEDTKEGLTVVVSVKLREPQFEGQTKAKLGNPEAKNAVEQVVSEGLTDFMERNPQDGRAIMESCLLAAKARKAAKAARQTVLRKGILEGMALPGKLADCSSRRPEESELYIVEGESAGGCFSGETKIALIDGRNLTFKQLVKEDKQGRKNYCYTIKEDNSIGIELIKNPRKTKKEAEVIKVVLDNQEEIICTPDHKFMLKKGGYKMAKDLIREDSLMPLYRKHSKIGGKITIKGYEMVFDSLKHYYIFTHLLADQYNLEKERYEKKEKQAIHHLDFNKLNNTPENIVRMDSQKHRKFHSRLIQKLMSNPLVQEKLRKIRQSKEYRTKIKATMLEPEMRKMLSARAKKQWENKEYKEYMTKKFLEFYKTNKKYREKNRQMLDEGQKKYWSIPENRIKKAKEIKEYFEKYPAKKEELSKKAKEQWKNKELITWRSKKSAEQWTENFRQKRKITYNKTYQEKALKLMKEIMGSEGMLNKKEYNRLRREKKDNSLLKYETICQRFFDNSEVRLKEAVVNYNHKIKRIVRMKERKDVYDFEVEKTHNFALASGVFVHNSAKQARDRRYQAILPLRGKILNVEKARLDRILDSKEIKNLIIALGTAIAQDFNLEKLRYHRIIIMTDADVDGSHIRTLLLTLFYRYLQPIIEKGCLYIAQPPLYQLQYGKKTEYAYSDEEKEKTISTITKRGDEKVNIQRYKGLGEMNPEQLWETTMDPKNRILLQVTVEDAKEADKIFDVLMGEEVFMRKRFIQTHAKTVKNLDI